MKGGVYRMLTFIYYLLKEGGQYFLVDFADRTKRMPLEIKECPADWMD